MADEINDRNDDARGRKIRIGPAYGDREGRDRGEGWFVEGERRVIYRREDEEQRRAIQDGLRVFSDLVKEVSDVRKEFRDFRGVVSGFKESLKSVDEVFSEIGLKLRDEVLGGVIKEYKDIQSVIDRVKRSGVSIDRMQRENIRRFDISNFKESLKSVDEVFSEIGLKLRDEVLGGIIKEYKGIQSVIDRVKRSSVNIDRMQGENVRRFDRMSRQFTDRMSRQFTDRMSRQFTDRMSRQFTDRLISQAENIFEPIRRRFDRMNKQFTDRLVSQAENIFEPVRRRFERMSRQFTDRMINQAESIFEPVRTRVDRESSRISSVLRSVGVRIFQFGRGVVGDIADVMKEIGKEVVYDVKEFMLTGFLGVDIGERLARRFYARLFREEDIGFGRLRRLRMRRLREERLREGAFGLEREGLIGALRRRRLREREEVEPLVVPSGEVSEFVQERGARILTDKLFVSVKEGVKFEGLERIAERGRGIFDYILELLGIRALIGRGRGAGARIFARVSDMLRGLVLALFRSRVLRVGGIAAGLGLLVYDLFGDMRRRGLREGMLSFLLGAREVSRFRRTVEGVMKGAVLGGVIGSIVPGIGTVAGLVVGGLVGGILHALGEEIRNIGSFLVLGIGNLSKLLIREFKDLKEKITEGFNSLFYSILMFLQKIGGVIKEGGKRVVESAVKGMETIKEYGGKLLELGKKGVTGFISMFGEIGVKRAEAAIRTEKGLAEALMVVEPIGKWIGPFQMTLESFREFAKTYGYWKELAKFPFLSREWMQTWRRIIEREGPQKVFQQMRDYMMRTHYEPMLEGLGEIGEVLVEKGLAIREGLFSIAVQYGPQLGRKLIMEAFRGYSVEQLRRMTPEQIIDILTETKKRTIPKYFPRYPAMWKGVERRAEEERMRLYALVEAERERMRAEARVKGQDVSVKREQQNLYKTMSEVLRSDVEVKRSLVPAVGEVAKVPEKGERVVSSIASQFFEVDKIPVAVDDVGILLIQLGLI